MSGLSRGFELPREVEPATTDEVEIVVLFGEMELGRVVELVSALALGEGSEPGKGLIRDGLPGTCPVSEAFWALMLVNTSE